MLVVSYPLKKCHWEYEMSLGMWCMSLNTSTFIGGNISLIINSIFTRCWCWYYDKWITEEGFIRCPVTKDPSITIYNLLQYILSFFQSKFVITDGALEVIIDKFISKGSFCLLEIYFIDSWFITKSLTKKHCATNEVFVSSFYFVCVCRSISSCVTELIFGRGGKVQESVID